MAKGWTELSQRCTRIDEISQGGPCTRIDFSFKVKSMSADEFPFFLPGVLTVGPRTYGLDKEMFVNAKPIPPAADDMLSDRVKELVKRVIESQIRKTAASMTIEQILGGAKSFKQEVFAGLKLELWKVGLVIYYADVKRPMVVLGPEYFSSYLGPKTLQEAVTNQEKGKMLQQAAGETAEEEMHLFSRHLEKLNAKPQEAEGSAAQEEARSAFYYIKLAQVGAKNCDDLRDPNVAGGEAHVFKNGREAQEESPEQARWGRLAEVARAVNLGMKAKWEMLCQQKKPAMGEAAIAYCHYYDGELNSEARLPDLEQQAETEGWTGYLPSIVASFGGSYLKNPLDRNSDNGGLPDLEQQPAEARRAVQRENEGWGTYLSSKLAGILDYLNTTDWNGGMPDLEAAAGNQVAGAAKEQVVRELWMLSRGSLFVGTSLGIHQPPATGSVFAGHQTAYYGVVASILAAVPVEMATEFWLRRSNNPRFQAVAEGVQRVGLLLLITAAAVGGYEITLKAA